MSGVRPVAVAGALTIGGDGSFTLIGGPCALESVEHSLQVGAAVRAACVERGIGYVFKASYDKANRSSVASYRGPGLAEGLRMLTEVRAALGVPILTDVHTADEVAKVAEVADVLQVPAFLCRQTDLLLACARSGRPVNVKKGQFLAPQDMGNIVEKLVAAGAAGVLLTERGTTFGYHDLVVDFRGLSTMRELGWPVVFDATHSVQQPGGLGHRSGGLRRFVPDLARAAVAVGVDAVFMEIHDDPAHAPSDGPNMVPLDQLPGLLDDLLALDTARRQLNPTRLVDG